MRQGVSSARICSRRMCIGLASPRPSAHLSATRCCTRVYPPLTPPRSHTRPLAGARQLQTSQVLPHAGSILDSLFLDFRTDRIDKNRVVTLYNYRSTQTKTNKKYEKESNKNNETNTRFTTTQCWTTSHRRVSTSLVSEIVMKPVVETPHKNIV